MKSGIPSPAAERNRTRRFFNLVAPIFPFIEKGLLPEYQRVLGDLAFDTQLSVLDLATGTGILAGSFANRGHAVTGIDFSEKLLRRAEKNYPKITFENSDLAQLDNVPAQSFGIVTMGFFLHGVDEGFRHFVLTQAARIAVSKVVVFDYGRPGNWFVHFIEWMEGPHYPGFLAASRQDEFMKAGLVIEEEARLSNSGSVWVCSK
jgi:ubiquinone/menaquinone biosynthesis C-methylase UbiE